MQQVVNSIKLIKSNSIGRDALNRRDFSCPSDPSRPYFTHGLQSLVTAITMSILDENVLGLFCLRKNVRLGVNGNPGYRTLLSGERCAAETQKNASSQL